MTTENANPNPNQGADPNAGADALAAKAKGADEATILAGGDDGKTAVTPADWPSDWRNKMAGEDKDVLKQLETFKSPLDQFKAYRALQQKLSSGEYKKPSDLPKDATPEQLTAYRKENGIPEKPEDYNLNDLGEGLVIGEEDRPVINEILKEVHAANVPDKYVKPIVAAYWKKLESERVAAADFDRTNWTKTEDALRAEMGNEYTANKNALANYLKTLPEEFSTALTGARLADGRKLLGTVEGVKLIMALANEANPAITVVPGSSNPAKTIAEEKKALNIGSDEYWKSPEKQARAKQLIDAEEKLKKRTG